MNYPQETPKSETENMGQTTILDSQFLPGDDVHSESLHGEAVLLDLKTGIYFGLNDVGTRIWELIAEGRSRLDIAASLTREFEVTRDSAERDVAAFLETLHNRGLIQVAPTPIVSTGSAQ
jgi:hypothetical protein